MRSCPAILAALLLAGCGGNPTGPDPGPICLETAEGSFNRPCAGSWLIRTEMEWQAFIDTCFPGGPPTRGPESAPPVPAPGEMVVAVSASGSGCSACAAVRCAAAEDGLLAVRLDGGFYGPCEALLSAGAWALVPESTMPVAFDAIPAGLPYDPAHDPCP